MKNLVLAALILSLTACAPMSDERATRALESQGYTEIQYHGMAFFGCSEDDVSRKSFTAKGANGKVVSGTVCGSFFKGATVRID